MGMGCGKLELLLWRWGEVCGCGGVVVRGGRGKIGGGGIEIGESWLDGRGGVVVIVGVSCGGNL